MLMEIHGLAWNRKSYRVKLVWDPKPNMSVIGYKIIQSNFTFSFDRKSTIRGIYRE
jgi:hypothetical protein